MFYSKIKNYFSLLFILNFLNCIGITSGLMIGLPIDKLREEILNNKTCNFKQTREVFHNAKKVSKNIFQLGFIADVFLGIYLTKIYYPNGLKTLGALYYIYFPSFILYQVDLNGLNYKTGWLLSREGCNDYSEIYRYSEEVSIELNPKMKENSQLNETTSKDILDQICFNKSKRADERIYFKLVEEIINYYKPDKSSRRNRRIESEFKNYKIKNNQNRNLDFEKFTVPNSSNLDLRIISNSPNQYETSSTLNCRLEYFIKYSGGEQKFIEENLEEISEEVNKQTPKELL